MFEWILKAHIVFLYNCRVECALQMAYYTMCYYYRCRCWLVQDAVHVSTKSYAAVAYTDARTCTRSLGLFMFLSLRISADATAASQHATENC